MIRCPVCGFANADSRDRCLKCSGALKSIELPASEHLSRRGEDASARFAWLGEAWYRIGQKLDFPLPENVGYRYPWTAAYLSPFLAAGQLYNRQPLKAALFAAIQCAIAAAGAWTLYEPWSNWVLLALLLWILAMMADGYVTAMRLNGIEWRWNQVAAMWFVFMFLVSGSVALLQLGGHGIFRLTTVLSANLAPSFQSGDKVFVACWPLFFGGRPRPGDVVFYNPPGYTVVRPGGLSNDTYSINERNSFGVVTAVEGDVMMWNKGAVAVNGSAVPPALMPLNPMGIPGNGQVKIPPGHVGILITHGSSEGGIFALLEPAFGSGVPNPAQVVDGGWMLRDYEQAIVVPISEIDGIVRARYYPPERRRMFRRGGGVQ